MVHRQPGYGRKRCNCPVYLPSKPRTLSTRTCESAAAPISSSGRGSPPSRCGAPLASLRDRGRSYNNSTATPTPPVESRKPSFGRQSRVWSAQPMRQPVAVSPPPRAPKTLRAPASLVQVLVPLCSRLTGRRRLRRKSSARFAGCGTEPGPFPRAPGRRYGKAPSNLSKGWRIAEARSLVTYMSTRIPSDHACETRTH